MNRVSLQFVQIIAKATALAKNCSLPELLHQSPLSTSEIEKSSGFVKWNDFVEWMEWLDSKYDRIDWYQIGLTALNRQTSPTLIFLTRMTLSVRMGYWLAAHWFGPSQITSTYCHRFEDLGPNKIRETLRLKENLKPCPQLFEFFKGTIASAPAAMFGLPRAHVEATTSGVHGVYEITFPGHRSPWKVLKARFMSFFNFPLLWRELAHQQKILQQQSLIIETERSEFRNLIEQFPDGILIHKNGIIQYMNPKLASFLQKDPEFFIGRSVLECLHPLDVQRVQDQMQTGTNRFYKPVEVSLIPMKSREPVLIEYTPIPMNFEGSSSVAIVVRDLSDRKKLQAHLMLTDRMRSLGQMAAGVGHEINNPLFFLMMKAEQLQNHLTSQKDSSGAEIASEIQNGLKRIDVIVKQLKAFTRGHDEEASVPVDLNKTLQSALDMAHSVIQAKAHLKVDFEKLPPVLGNEARMGQVFLNLLINAAQAIEKGTPQENEVEVRTRTLSDNKVQIEIRDTGTGIPEEVRPHLFQPFYTTKAIGNGTGLGLSICHAIVSRYHGMIEYETEVGHGTRFVLTFPATREDSHAVIESSQEPIYQPRTSGRVLILDDDEELLSVLDSVVSERFNTVALRDGREALQGIRSGEDFDCIVCDLMMPQMDGMQFYQEVEKTRPELCDKFIFITGGSLSSQHDQFLNRPGLRSQEKPVSSSRLLNLIQDVILEVHTGKQEAIQ